MNDKQLETLLAILPIGVMVDNPDIANWLFNEEDLRKMRNSNPDLIFEPGIDSWPK
jgi:hypothetical protein